MYEERAGWGGERGGGKMCVLTMRTGAGAAIGVISELVDMYTPLRIRVIALDVVRYCGWSRFGGLFERDCAPHVGIATENGDCDGSGRKD